MKIKKILSLVISVLLIFSSIPFTVFAATGDIGIQHTEMRTPTKYYSSAISSVPLDGLAEVVDLKVFKEYILEQAKSVPDVIDISNFNIPYSLYPAVDELVWYNMPELFNVYASGFSHDYEYLFTLQLVYREFADTEAEYSKCLSDLVSSAEKMLEGVKGNQALSEAEKALLLHDRLAMHTEYDFIIESEMTYTAYGAFCNKSAVCQGYTMAYMYLLNEVGIESYYCSSYMLNHAWNILYIDGKAYHTDVTWDDVSWGNSGRGIVGRVYHKNFLRSTAGIISTGHGSDDFDSTPTDTTYDNYYWQNSGTQFCLVDDELYYIDNENEVLMKKGSNTPLCSVSRSWSAGGNMYYVENYSCLAQIGNTLVYSLDDEIYSYNVKTNSSKAIHSPTLASGYSVFGFTYENGYLVCDINNTLTATENLTQTKTAYSIECDHSFADRVMGSYLVSAADCKNPATYKKSCSLCGSASTETFTYGSKDLTNHSSVVTVAAVKETCTSKGYTEGKYCNSCKNYLSGHEEISATGHINKYNVAEVKGSCSAKGYTAGVFCPDCNIYLSGHSETDFDISRHINTVITDAVEPTEENPGYTKGVYCKDCLKYISGHVELPRHNDFADYDEAKKVGDGIYAVAGTNVERFLCQASSGAYLRKADGERAELFESLATGMELVFPNGTKKTVVVCGDVDGDGSISSADARLALRIAVNLENYSVSSPNYKAAAVAEGEVTSAAARLILRASVGLEDSKSLMK